MSDLSERVLLKPGDIFLIVMVWFLTFLGFLVTFRYVSEAFGRLDALEEACGVEQVEGK